MADLQEQHAPATEIRDTTNSIYNSIRTLRSVREQVQSVSEHASEAGHDGLTDQAETITQELTEIEEELMQTKNESFQDPLNFPPMLDNQYAALYGYVSGPDAPPTEGAEIRFEDLNEQWSTIRNELHTFIDSEVAAFNERVREVGSYPVFIPATDP